MKNMVVILHLFYQDLWEEIEGYLRNIKYDFDIIITICKDHKDTVTNKIYKTFPNARIISMENRGGDIGPFFECMNLLIQEGKEYDLLLKIHSKKRLGIKRIRDNPEASRAEREKCIIPLVGTEQSVEKNIEILSNKKVGMVGAAKNLYYDGNCSKEILTEGEKYMLFFMEKFGVKTPKRIFFVGTMFWCRYNILKKYLSRYRLDLNYFKEGPHNVGGPNAAHAAERFLGRIFANEDLDIVGV